MSSLLALRRWFDSSGQPDPSEPAADRIDWLRCLPFFALHLGCLGVLWTGTSVVAVAVAVALYLFRMFAITAFYHRYFSHRSFRTSRVVQFLMAVAGGTAAQRGPLWWAAHHRHHHGHSDDPPDLHSPRWKGFLRSHMGWFMTKRGFATPTQFVKDLARYPELRLLDRFDWLMPALLAVGCYWLGEALRAEAPALATTGPQMLVWGFFISTIAVYHGTYTINSLAHTWGRRRFATDDDSRNNVWLALLTLGEGWHNNHHRYPSAARQGFYWWEIDLCYYALRALAWTGVIWDLKGVPQRVLDEGRGETSPR